MSRMHLKWPSGQTRSKQGLHSTPRLTIFALSFIGGVYAGFDEP